MCYSLPCSSGLASIIILLCTNRLLFRIVERGVDRWNPCLSGFHGSKSVFSWGLVCGVLSAQSLFCALASTDMLLRKMVHYFRTVEWFVGRWNPCVRCFVEANLCLFGTRSMVFPLPDFDKTSYTILFRMSFVTFAFFFVQISPSPEFSFPLKTSLLFLNTVSWSDLNESPYIERLLGWHFWRLHISPPTPRKFPPIFLTLSHCPIWIKLSTWVHFGMGFVTYALSFFRNSPPLLKNSSSSK